MSGRWERFADNHVGWAIALVYSSPVAIGLFLKWLFDWRVGR